MLNFRTNLQLDGSLGLIVKLIKNFFDVSFDMKYWMTYIVGPTSYYINVLKESNCIWHFFYLMLAALLVHNGCVLVLTNYRIISSKVLSLWIFPVVFWFGHKSKYFFTHGVWVCWFSLKIIKAHRSHNDDRVWPQRSCFPMFGIQGFQFVQCHQNMSKYLWAWNFSKYCSILIWFLKYQIQNSTDC